MALESVLIEFGGKTLAKVIGNKFGPQAQEMADAALGYLGEVFGAEPTPAAIEAKIDASKQTAAPKIAIAEGRAVDLVLAQVEMMKAGNEQQKLTNELLVSQQQTGGWKSDWLYAWQWFLMLCWAWTLLIVHILNAALRITANDAVGLPAPEVGSLLTLTTLYLGLHMGGHTVLELVRNKWGGLFGRADERAGAAESSKI